VVSNISCIIVQYYKIWVMKINAVKEGYYRIWDVDNDIKLDQKNSEVEAIQGLVNYQLEGKNVIMIPPSYRVDIIDEIPADCEECLDCPEEECEDCPEQIICPEPVICEECEECIEPPAPEVEISYVEGYVHMTTEDGVQYIRVGATRDILRLEGDIKARDGQGKFIIQRTGSNDLIDTYELFGTQPFEIDNDHEIDYETSTIKLWATEPWRIEYYVNGILDSASDPSDLPVDQYNSSQTEDEMYRHTRQINATYGDKIEVIAYNAEGESDSFQFYIETLQQLDKSARIKELNKQILAIMQEPLV